MIDLAKPEVYEGLKIAVHGLFTTASSNALFCSTAMEDYPIVRQSDPIEWRCEGCGSVMLKEHRKCEECGAPRHFIYGAGDDR